MAITSPVPGQAKAEPPRQRRSRVTPRGRFDPNANRRIVQASSARHALNNASGELSRNCRETATAAASSSREGLLSLASAGCLNPREEACGPWARIASKVATPRFDS